MTATVLGRVKRGDDKTFRSIVVAVAGQPQDLTADDWTVRAQARRHPDATTAVDLNIDPAALAISRVVLSLTHTQTAVMAPGRWVADVEITSPHGVRSSQTMTIEIVADITRIEEVP